MNFRHTHAPAHYRLRKRRYRPYRCLVIFLSELLRLAELLGFLKAARGILKTLARTQASQKGTRGAPCAGDKAMFSKRSKTACDLQGGFDSSPRPTSQSSSRLQPPVEFHLASRHHAGCGTLPSCADGLAATGFLCHLPIQSAVTPGRARTASGRAQGVWRVAPRPGLAPAAGSQRDRSRSPRGASSASPSKPREAERRSGGATAKRSGEEERGGERGREKGERSEAERRGASKGLAEPWTAFSPT